MSSKIVSMSIVNYILKLHDVNYIENIEGIFELYYINDVNTTNLKYKYIELLTLFYLRIFR